MDIVSYVVVPYIMMQSTTPYTKIDLYMQLVLVSNLVKLVLTQFLNKNKTEMNIQQQILTFVCLCLVIHVSCVLFGSPFVELIHRTFMLSVITASHLFNHVLQFDSFQSFQDISRNVQEMVRNPKVFCLLSGMWIGVLPIPLDWEMEWQVYPFTP